MVTVSHIVEKILRKRPFLEEVVARKLINYAALANTLKPEIENELGKKVKHSAIMMALRRFSQKMEKGFIRKAQIRFKETDITIKSGLFEITILKGSSFTIHTIKKIYDLIDYSKGDFLTVTQGIYEITIISNKKHKDRIQKILEDEKTVKVIDGLSSLTVRIPIEAIETVGLFYVITKALNWENINIIEIVSTLTEMTFIFKEEDVARAFNVMKSLESCC